MKQYKRYKEAYPNLTDAEIIERIATELADKVETIHNLLDAEKQVLLSFIKWKNKKDDNWIKHISEDEVEDFINNK